VGIFEVFLVNDEIAKLILQKSAGGDIQKAAIRAGMLTMTQDGYLKAIEGGTTLEEILRVVKY